MIEELKAIIEQQEASVIPVEDGPATFPSGTPWALCWAWADDLQRRLGSDRVKKYGFSDEDNEASEIARLCGGHDFAVVDHRYIVDGWAANVELVHKTGVLDLEDPDHFDDITRLFGDPRCWKDGDAESEYPSFSAEDDNNDLRNQLASRLEAAKATSTHVI